MSLFLPSEFVIDLTQLSPKGNGYQCWGDTDYGKQLGNPAGPPQYALPDTRQRSIPVADPNRPNESYPYSIPPYAAFRFPRPVDRFAIYLMSQKAEDQSPDPTPPGIRFMIRAGAGNYQSRIWQGDFLQPVYQNPPGGSGLDNQERGLIVEVCGPAATQWEVFALSIIGSGGRAAGQQLIQLYIVGMVASNCGYHYQPGPGTTQTFPTP